MGTESTHCRTGRCGMTSSVRCAATSAMRRALQEGQTPRPLQEKARSRSCPQSVHRSRAKPWARMQNTFVHGLGGPHRICPQNAARPLPYARPSGPEVKRSRRYPIRAPQRPSRRTLQTHPGPDPSHALRSTLASPHQLPVTRKANLAVFSVGSRYAAESTARPPNATSLHLDAGGSALIPKRDRCQMKGWGLSPSAWEHPSIRVKCPRQQQFTPLRR